MVKRHIFVVTTQILLTWGFFHIPSGKMVSVPGLPEDALFGYSITHQVETKSLIISAPKATYVGQVFVFEPNDNITKLHNVLDTVILQTTKTYHILFGATVKASGSYFATCAPRYTEKKKKSMKGDKAWATLSMCYINHGSILNGTMERQPTLLYKDRVSFGKHLEERMDSFGWSIEISNPDMDIVMGSPIQRGQVSVYNPLKDKHPKLINKINPGNPVAHNYGYSVATGKFFTDEMLYAISSTYGNVGIGMVYIFNKKLINIYTINGGEVGSMFGATLCAVKLNEKLDSLLVGAPTYADNEYITDSGAVYVYRPDSFQRLVLKKVIRGTAVGGYFGRTIANLGDIDSDGFHEVAISAPYENEGAGAVYIYSSYALINEHITYRNRIAPEGFRAFGLSVTAMTDYNDNGCNDIAIGAPDSNKVVIYKCMPTVTVLLEAEVPSLQVKSGMGMEYLNMTVCLHVTYPKKPILFVGEIEIKVQLSTMYSRLVDGGDDGTFIYYVSLERRLSKYCRKLLVQVTVPNKPFFQVIEYQITARSRYNFENVFRYNENGAILSDRSRLSIEGKEFSSSCGDRRTICNPNLIHTFTRSMHDLYIIGSTEKEKFSISIQNTGEPAYTPCAVIQTIGVNVLKHPKGCTRENKELICKPPFTLTGDNLWTIEDVQLETSSLKSRDTNITINLDMYNHCNNPSEKQHFEYSIDLFSDKNINITGHANPDDIINTTAVQANTFGKRIEHVFTITNLGKTNWVDLECEILFNDSFYIDFNKTTIFANSEKGTIECSLNSANASSDANTFTCNVGDMRTNQKIFVHILIETKRDSFLESKLETNVSISTEIFLVHRNQAMNSLRINTIFNLQVPSVPLWIIIIASLASLLLLAIIVFILYKCGFLRRKKKEETLLLKKEIRRRTMLRQSTRQSVPRQSNLNEQNNVVYQEIEDFTENEHSSNIFLPVSSQSSILEIHRNQQI